MWQTDEMDPLCVLMWAEQNTACGLLCNWSLAAEKKKKKRESERENWQETICWLHPPSSPAAKCGTWQYKSQLHNGSRSNNKKWQTCGKAAQNKGTLGTVHPRAFHPPLIWGFNKVKRHKWGLGWHHKSVLVIPAAVKWCCARVLVCVCLFV